jgi:hypothetical protein
MGREMRNAEQARIFLVTATSSFQQNCVDRAKDMLPLWMSAVITRAAMALIVRASRLSEFVSAFRKMSPHGIGRPSVGLTGS